ncbi:MAG TPA: SLBB domain-containing protein [Terracidiphilus sp.]|nr:SLBB domain-containing protein [Terracidiphilus sp.]
MLQLLTYFGEADAPETQNPHGNGRLHWLLQFVACTTLFGVCTPFVHGQVSDSAPTPQSGDTSSSLVSTAITPDEGASNAADRVGLTASGSASSSSVLSADRIVDILEQNPDLTVELKSLVADRMQTQGAQISANDLSDEMLYDQIAANPSLRAGITTYLRARGYVAPGDMLTQQSGVSENGAETEAMPAGNLAALPGQAGSGTSAQSSNLDMGNLPMGEGSVPTTANELTAGYSRGQQAPEKLQQRNEVAHSAVEPPKVLHRPAPYNLQSMRDLYTQIPTPSEPLRRFGSAIFTPRNATATTRGLSSRDTPLDVPIGPDYVIGAGDSLTVDLWGGVTQSMTRVVDRDGRLLLPDTAPISVAGLPLNRAQTVIEDALQRQYRNAHAAVTVARPRSVRVYVVGDVQRPGGYDVSSLATPLSALYAAGGPTAAGSLRRVLHYRGKQLIEEVDLYDFLLHGVQNGSARFESGDSLLVPPAGMQVAVSGAVRRPAIYELLASGSTLAAVVDDAGGLTAAASPGHVRIERIDPNQQRETVTVSLKRNEDPTVARDAMSSFAVKDGDRIYVEPILPYSTRVVYLEGHVVRPGRLPYSDGMHLSDALTGYRDMLPEPSEHGEIVRLVAPDLHAETIDFTLSDVLSRKTDLPLEPFDTIRVLGRYEADAPKVTILGEVLRPGVYPLSANMTAAQLVRMAGGFKRDALLESADLTSYDVVNGSGIAGNLATVRIGAAVSKSDAQADVQLKPGDILMIHQMTGWNEIGQSVSVVGQVKYPGSYGFKEGERLSSVLRRAGGFLPAAYPMGAVLVREQVRELQEKSREELIRQIETNSAAARLSPTSAGANGAATLQLIKAQQDEVISDLKSHPATGRMVIQIAPDIDSWANTSADVELRQGDVITIPRRPGFVLITGQVYNATALTYRPGRTAGWYLSHAGGANATADRKDIFIIRANGSVVGRRSGGWFEGDVLSTRLNPGDVVVVPQKILGSSLFWKNLLATGQLAASFALSAGVAVAAL